MKKILLGVYISISVATFYHSAWGFATLSGAEPHAPNYFAMTGWWLLGMMMAIAVDVGIGAIVWIKMNGEREHKFSTASLILLGLWSAYGQLIYSANHAAAYNVGEVAGWLQWLQYPLDARVLLNPLVLPLFAILIAFIAKDNEPQPTPKRLEIVPLQESQSHATNGKPITPDDLQWGTPTERRAIVRKLSLNGLQNSDIAKMIGVAPSTVTRDLKNGKTKK